MYLSTSFLGHVLSGVLIGLIIGGSPVRADDPSPGVERALATVDSFRSERDFQAALARLHQLSQAHPETGAILWRRSILWSDLGRVADSNDRALSSYRQALDFAEAAIEVDPTNAWAHAAKAVAAGRVARSSNSNKESIQQSRNVKEHADRAIALDSSLAVAYHVRARWHREISDLNFVERLVVKAVYGGLPDASIEKAVRDFQEAIRFERQTYHYLELGKTYKQMGRREAAREQFQLALEMPWADPFDREYKQEARMLLHQLS